MFSLYMLLREIPFESHDPVTKDLYGVCTLALGICAGVLAVVLRMLMVAVAIDIVAGDLIPSDIKCCLADFMIKGLFCGIIPVVSLVMFGLIYSGLMVEI